MNFESKVVIDFNALLHNINFIKRKVDLEHVIAVVKAHAYGHGLVEVSSFLLQNNIRILGVARVEEALKIAKSIDLKLGEDYNIIVMGYTPNEILKLYSNSKITFTIMDIEQAVCLNDYYNKVHIKVNTGFNRLGRDINDDLIEEIISINDLENISVEACFSHLRLVNNKEDEDQYKKLLALKDKLYDVNNQIKFHINDSVGFIRHPQFNLDYVRIGALLYGLFPSSQEALVDVKPVMSVYSYVSNIIDVKKGEGVGYSEGIANQDMTIATIPIGYADGYKRSLTTDGYVVINNNHCKIVSLICMDQLMVDVTNMNIKQFDKVEILSERISADTLAKLASTNKNDIVSGFCARLDRKYLGCDYEE